MRFCIFEDTHFSNFLPLDYFRPVYQLRCGIFSPEEKIRLHFPRLVGSLHVRSYLADYLREENPRQGVNLFPRVDTWFINGRVIADDGFVRELKSVKHEVVLHMGNEIAAAFVKAKNITQCTKGWHEQIDFSYVNSLPSRSISCTIARYPWDLVHHNAEEIERDSQTMWKKRSKKRINGHVYSGVHLLNKKNIFIGKQAQLKPGVVLDAEKGPITIDDDATIMPNAFIQGPAYIGKHTLIKVGAKIYGGTTIGEYCKVGGEVEGSIIQSYSNKQHDGFLGHAYLGSWVNLGADTNNSDLKNNYSTVKVTLHGTQIDTGVQFFGLVMGDHSKTGINVMFDTGTIVGTCCNIYGAGLPPKSLPSFSWGSGNAFTAYDLEKSLDTARKVLKRRNIELTPAYEKLYRHVHSLTLQEKH
jgi:UDP-N-acetylglucosamine diphosphorylase / glucose-1-phosphate thymidylyltransferase / UDP-N-acetylgalactosamine diphosphorylase / glucosamine-1-phosphate N-acetyltransferase / galactosamine-1-phosphate N-acetyltransferase